MQKKQLNKVLIAALIIIWGVLIVKYVSPFFKSDKSVTEFAGSTNVTNFKIFKRDTFLLKTIKRDPFLNNPFRVRKKSVKKTSKKKPTNIKKPLVWPKIAYLGYVKSNQSANRLGLVRINSKLHKVRENLKIEEISVLKILNDSVLLKFEDQKKYFSRK